MRTRAQECQFDCGTVLDMAKELSYKLDSTGRATYPWEKWTNGNAWLLVRGEDYECSLLSIRSAVHQHARRNGLRVTTTTPSSDEIARHKGEHSPVNLEDLGVRKYEGLIVQFEPREERRPAKVAKRPGKKLRRKSRPADSN